jgi:hypothetical protein
MARTIFLLFFGLVFMAWCYRIDHTVKELAKSLDIAAQNKINKSVRREVLILVLAIAVGVSASLLIDVLF